MAAHAGRHVFGRNSFREYRLARNRFWRSAGLARNRALGGVIGRDAFDGGIAQLCGHAPHISLRMWVGAGLVAKGLQLGNDIILLLASEARKGRRDAAAVRAVT